MWRNASQEMPKANTHVIIKLKVGKEIQKRIGVVRWEHPTHEDTFQAYRYWDDPFDDGKRWDYHDILEWTEIPE